MYKLDDIDKKNPFTVPENYFTDFNAEIMARLPAKKARSVSLWKKSKPWVYAAALIAGAFLVARVATKNHAENSQSVMTSSQTVSAADTSETYWSKISISEDEFYQYLEEQLVDDGYYNYLYEELYHQAVHNM